MFMLTPEQCQTVANFAIGEARDERLVLLTQESDTLPLNTPQNIHLTWSNNSRTIDPEGKSWLP